MNPHQEYEAEFGAQVRQWRRHCRWSQEELAQKMTAKGFSMHQTTIAKLEVAARPITLSEASALEAIFWDGAPPQAGMPVCMVFEERPRLPGMHWIPR